MRKRALHILLFPILALSLWGQTAQSDKGEEPQSRYANMPVEAVPFRKFTKPYHEWFVTKDTLEYSGAASDRHDGDSGKLSEVAIGFLGPLENNPEAVFGVPALHAAQLAMDEANAKGGYQGKPFALKVYNDSALWGASSTVLPSMLFMDNCWAVLGSIDGQSTHIMIRVSLKLEVPILSAGSTDRTVNETRIQWLMDTFPDDRLQGYALANHIFRELNLQRIGIIRTNSRYARIGVGVLGDVARRLGHPPALEVKFDRGDTDFSRQLRMLQAAKIDAVIFWGEAPEAGHLLKQMRAMGMNQPVFGSSRTAYPQLLEIAGEAAEGYTAAVAMNPARTDSRWTAFREKYHKHHGEDPDPYAAFSYDGMNILIHAIQESGLNRGRIMEYLRAYATKEWDGVAGHYVFDYTLNNVAPMTLGRVEGGKFKYWTAPHVESITPVVAESR